MLNSEEIKKQLSPEDVVFATELMDGKYNYQAAMTAYKLPKKEAAKKAERVKKKGDVMMYIKSCAYGAASRIEALSQTAQNEMVRLHANKDILDRAGYKPQEAAININIPLYLPAEVMEKYGLKAQTPMKEIPPEDLKQINP